MKSRRKGERRFSRAAHHLREVENILYDRRGCDDAELYLGHAVNEAAACFRVKALERQLRPDEIKIADTLGVWCELWAPAFRTEAKRIASRAVRGCWNLSKPDALGVKLRLSDADRTRLVIRTIGSYDVDSAARSKRRADKKRQRDKRRSAEKRASLGATPRAQWLASRLSRTKPWEPLGITRRTYERRRAKGTLTAP